MSIPLGCQVPIRRLMPRDNPIDGKSDNGVWVIQMNAMLIPKFLKRMLTIPQIHIYPFISTVMALSNSVQENIDRLVRPVGLFLTVRRGDLGYVGRIWTEF